ncbi:DNA helicase-2/ATP-dependent DNA helicase PcrA [Clostridium saccharoperbutylacetonicum]|uniref:DNA 3'-5' helicase n=1 Tax=Clostridium saccharoperbutylacetonicum N1-4(HMT) TaxID=931276 RepID=M1MFL6_9CLOT|nr:ATP-dependent helicase [Clostridium saccharoperbutylacetonicum]AGF56709.1 ATP-dependent DNA helicase Rep [Clostridium saccharoperbutylacetonicum N1-4(HMT)]NRT62536.1 DNA helicase-2/ATP-dependent DNA helicase PcrA [Clostridium saccharoperbutylacetonicum]NSB25882.1 DNA helicase-2/ATP-dependent DNA helicase PcrA [Clostridium saccharoperbutylacetonicum]NSB45242.1 DNA helicase-2/ATP-dependent DNA helicase PcrA [Clostridium saccharoperbutylacetonicum]
MHYEKDLERLNEYQREAVLDESDACVVNANVGSGKTTILISKIIYLHYAKNISYKDMIVLTFTNKAANEIRERLLVSDSTIKPEELEGFGTFHSVALNLLKNKFSIEEMGYTKDFLVIEPEEELDIALQIIQEEKLKIKYKNRLKKRLEKAMSIEEEEEKTSPYDDDIFKLANLLKEEKIKQNKMSFLDILKNATTLLEDNKLSSKWIIIDEVQDSDKIQLDFIDKLKGENTKLFAVGDPNQVIYTWRGSSLNVVYTLKHKYNAKELSLPINYRSNSFILSAARYFQQSGNELIGAREAGNKIKVKKQYNSFNEACYLADKIKEIHKSGVSYKEIAVFYRLQEQSQAFEDVFFKNDIPYEVSLKKTIRDIPVLNWVIKLFRFCVNNNDFTSGVYVLSDKEYGERMTEKTAKIIVKEQNTIRSELLFKMHEFINTCSEPKDSEQLYNYFEFDKYIKPTSSTYTEDKESICTLINIIIEYVKEKHMPFISGLKDFINSSALYGVNILKKDINNEADSVKLMTLHASKGLEFSYVFITGVNYGLIPLQTRDFEEEEEMRLFFVGITRAKDYLELSYYTNPDYKKVAPGESRYIRMIPEKLIENDEVKNESVNLQELKKQIIEARKIIKNNDAEIEKSRVSEENKEEIIALKKQKEEKLFTEGQREDNILISENEEPLMDVKVNREVYLTDKVNEEESVVNEIVRDASSKQVTHKKYGTGKVLKEDEMMIEVEFENYGIKEFIKAFSEFDFL